MAYPVRSQYNITAAANRPTSTSIIHITSTELAYLKQAILFHYK